jgi:hypothetical protein
VTAYVVVFDAERPATMSRAHVFLRIVNLALLSWIGTSGSWTGLFCFGFPFVAEVFVAQRGVQGYLDQDGDRVTRWIGFALGLIAYLALLTDNLPDGVHQNVRLEIVRSGSPSVGSCLMRILKAIPSAFVLFLYGVVGCFVWLLAVISILVSERSPTSLWNIERGLVRWEARLLAYLASLVDPYPPYSFETGPAQQEFSQ